MYFEKEQHRQKPDGTFINAIAFQAFLEKRDKREVKD